MGRVAHFAAVNTKIKVMQRDFLSNEDYRNLLESSDVEDALRYLRERTAYGSLLSDKDSHEQQLKQLESKLRLRNLGRYEKLVHYLVGPYRELFKIIFMRFEVENLKVVFRAILRKEPLEELIGGFYRSDVFPHLDYSQLITAKTIEEAVHYLQDTEYYRPLKPYINEAHDRILFYLEMNLDRIYFNKLAKAIARLPHGERKRVEEFLGKNADILNIQWIYRGIKFYKISSEELFNYCLNSGYILRLKELKQLSYAMEETDLVERLRKTRYAFLFKENTDINLYMELGMEKYLFSMLKVLDKEGELSILPSIVYIHRLEYEMRDLFSLLQAKKFGLNAEDTEKFLVRTIH